MSDLVGQQLGKYRLLSLLGRGGFADVYLGEHVHLRKKAAVKVLHGLYKTLTADDLENFKREAQVIADLRHPHIVQVLDFDIEDNTPYLVMQYAPEGTLRQRHPQGETLPIKTVLNYVKQIAKALQYAHIEKKLIHRDLKPENLLLDQDQKILLSDFGIALTVSNSFPKKTQNPAGTPKYMAPEQMKGKAEFRSDQYALGVIVYEWLCGQYPFGDAQYENDFQIKPLHELNPTIPLSVEQVVLQALQKEPSDRHISVRDFARKLKKACQFPPQTVSKMPTIPLPGVKIASPQKASRLVLNELVSQRVAKNDTTIRGGSTQPPQVSPVPVNAPQPRQIPPSSIPTKYLYLKRRFVLAGIISALVGSWIVEGLNVAFNRSVAVHPTPIPTHAVSPTATHITPTQTHPSPTVSPTPVLPAKGVLFVPPFIHGDNVSGLAWSPDSHRIASSGFDGTVKVWDIMKPGNPAMKYTGHQIKTGKTSVLDVAWSPDKNFDYIASCANSQVHIWNAGIGRGFGKILYEPYINQKYQVNAVIWQPESTIKGWLIVSASGDGTIRLWNRDRDVWKDIYIFPTSPINTNMSGVVWSTYEQSQYLAACSTDKNQGVWVWEYSKPDTIIFNLPVYGDVLSIACSPVYHYVAVGYGASNTGMDTGKVEIYDYFEPWDIQSQPPVTFMAQPYIPGNDPPKIQKVAWSPDGNYVAAGTSDGLVWLFDTATGNQYYKYSGHRLDQNPLHPLAVNALAWSHDGTMIASGGSDNKVRIWYTGLPPMNS